MLQDLRTQSIDDGMPQAGAGRSAVSVVQGFGACAGRNREDSENIDGPRPGRFGVGGIRVSVACRA